MILVLRALGVGDLATGVPALRALRAAFPSQTLTLAAPGWLTPLIALIGGVDRVLPVDGLTPFRVEAPSLAVNLHGSGPQSHRLLLRQHPEKLWAFGGPVGPEWSSQEHEVRRWCRLLEFYGVDTDPSALGLAIPSDPVPHGVTIVHPGAKSPSRRWPPERYAAVARELHAAGHDVIVTGSAAERDVAAKVVADAGLVPAAVPDTSLSSLAALIAHARLLISGDTGVSHLATAYGTPSVTLFGPMSPALWGPPPDRLRHRVIWHGTESTRGDRPGPDPHPALLEITVDEVLNLSREETS
ncbi:glycosyltransferase family 9 protein [Actinoplanes sp. HUAS TT8]|uniref:glycosyltransferase family 9 protein n=1 Tax=Actinoplanes sp. HUAS TT8 TaxID=3447453 RepID=UPI003F5239B2